jgi:hypothetical protein
LRYHAQCFVNGEIEEIYRCGAGVTLKEPSGRRRTLARGSLPTGSWGTAHEFEVRLTRLGRKLAARHGGTRAAVTLRLTTDGDPGFSFVERWTIRLEHN